MKGIQVSFGFGTMAAVEYFNGYVLNKNAELTPIKPTNLLSIRDACLFRQSFSENGE